MDMKLFRIRPKVRKDAPQDKTIVVMSREEALAHGIELDETGFPNLSSLEAWHRLNNPHLFTDEEVDDA